MGIKQKAPPIARRGFLELITLLLAAAAKEAQQE
jgi:hypothetical protein